MAKKKELYKLAVVDDRLLLRVPPQLVGAEVANLDDIQRELHVMDVPYLPERLLEIYERNTGNFEELSDLTSGKFLMQVEISHDEQSAFLNLIPPAADDATVTIEEVEHFLEQHDVVQGLNPASVQKMIDEKSYYDFICVAQGGRARNGTNGTPELTFMDRSGYDDLSGIDLRTVPMMQKVEAGQVLARVYAPTDGDDGYSVKGRAISAVPGRICQLVPGQNARYGTARNEIVADKDGVVCYHNGALHVHDLKTVDNIHAGVVRFDGVLQVKGNIGDSCRVEAFRIEVSGSIGQSVVRATSDVHVQQNVLKGTIQAGGSFSANELMEATVTAGEHLFVLGNITDSTVSGGECVRILNKDGDVAGSKIEGGYVVLVPSVGAQEGAKKSTLEVGISLSERKRIREREDELKSLVADFSKEREAVDAIVRRWGKGKPTGNDEKDLAPLGEEIAQKVSKTHRYMREIRGFKRISDISEQMDGGAVILTGKAIAGTSIFVRRTRFNLVSDAEGMAYQFSQNGVQTRPYEPVLELYQKYLIDLPEE